MSTDIKGIDSCIRNLNREIKGIRNRSMRGLIRATAFVRRDMDVTPPIIPIDTGNLRASYFTETGYKSKSQPYVRFGFAAYYAAYVHERIDESINWKRPGSGAKFFESALNRNTNEIVNIVKRETIIP